MTVAPVGRSKDSGVSGEPEGTYNPESSEKPQARSLEQPWLDDIVELVGPPAVLLDQTHRILSVNSRFFELCKTSRASMIGRHIRDAVNGMLNARAIREALADFESDSASGGGHKKQTDLSLAGRQPLTATIWRLPATFQTAKALLVIDDADERSTPGKKLRDVVHGAQLDPRGPLSVETLHHDLRQPLQTLSLLQGILAVREGDPAIREHIARLSEAIEALSGILNVLDDIERPSASPATPRFVGFPINRVLDRLRSEFSYHAEARGLTLNIVPSRAVIYSDPRLLEQALRALLLVAIKMIKRGKILLGGRRRRDKLGIEVWISGDAISSQQQQAILNEFHRSAVFPNEKGIAHSIVRPLSDALGLSVKARTRPGTGLAFTADVPMSPISQSNFADDTALHSTATEEFTAKGTVAVVSDSPREREALTLLLRATGYQVVLVRHDAGGVKLEGRGGMQPEIIVGDFSRLADRIGSHVIEELRHLLGLHAPAIVIADEVWRAAQSSSISDPVTHLSKPVSAEEITTQVVQALVTARRHLAAPRVKHRPALQQTTFIVDDDRLLREAMSALLRSRGEQVELYSSGESFLEDYTPLRHGCLVVDDKLPGLRGVELLEKLRAEGATIPAIMITGHGDIATAVRAMKAGAIDYMEKPVFHERLLSAIDHALEIDEGSADSLARRQQLAARFAALTQRERQVLDLVVKGASSKSIARVLNISQRTVENHRAAVMKRMGATSLSDLIRTVMQLGLSHEQ